MPKQRRNQSAESVISAQNSNSVLLVGIVCLMLGLAVGYYFGKESGKTHPVVQSQPQTQLPSQAPVVNPAAFLQEESTLKLTLASNPKNLNALIQLGNLYYDHQKFPEAIEYYGQALAIDPRNPNVRTDRGTSYWNIGQADAAINEFKKSLEADPSHSQTLYNLGVVYLNGKSNPEEARRVWERLLAVDPNYPQRAIVEQQLRALPPAAGSAGGNTTPDASMQDLLERMKKR